MYSRWSIFVLLGVICVACSQWENTIYIDSKNGHDNVSCLVTENIPCATLEYAIENGLQNSTQFVLLGEVVTLNITVVIEDSDHISFTSGDLTHPTFLKCSSGNGSAGLFFRRVTNLFVSSISIQNCGNILPSTTRDHDRMLNFRSAVYVLNSTNVRIEFTDFTKNPGIGLVLFDTNGNVSIQHSRFTENYVPQSELESYAGGGGMYIEHTYCTPGELVCDSNDNPYSNGSHYIISNCYFGLNRASILPERGITWVRFEKTSSNRLGRGGGIAITIKGDSTQNTFQITNCTFEDNSAEFGGALNIQLQDYSTLNAIEVKDCQFVNNSAEVGGGGALFLGIFFYDCDCVHGNKIEFNRVQYSNNRALYGGAIIFSSSRSKLQDLNNDVKYTMNTWSKNAASLGAAVLLSQEAWNAHALSSGYLPSPVFEDCTFIDNKIESNTSAEENLTFQTTEGVLFSSSYSINFTSSVRFLNNQGTAISITAGFVNILDNTTANFTGNQGNRGGALALLEFASLRTFPGSVLHFDSNSATSVGGAIYASSSDDTDFYYSRSCFIVFSDDSLPDPKDWNTSFLFSRNQAGPCSAHEQQGTPTPICPRETVNQYGHSIFAISILACDRATEAPGRDNPRGYFFKQDPPFHFLTGMYISTDPSTIMIDPDVLDSDVLRFSPGENKNISLSATDDIGNRIHSVYTASVVSKSNDSVMVDSSSLYVSDNAVELNGVIGAEFQLNLRTVARRIVSISINASLVNCPPGLIYSESIKKCVCSAILPNQQYNGITKCSTEVFGGILDRGYWAGCYGENDSILLTAECPFGFCRYDDDRENNNISLNDPVRSTFFVLPKTCGEVDEFLCGQLNREGDLCGKCKENFSVFYHSQHFTCHECDGINRYVGFLFYFLTEILPVTILFFIIVGFNVHLTSGLWCSVILFGQIIDFLEFNSRFYISDRRPSPLTNIYKMIYSSFNLDFFKYDDDLSFCLFDGATGMWVLIIKYVTIVYTVTLLVILILSFRSSCCNKCQGLWQKLDHIFNSGSTAQHSWVIHGIAAFLVLSYAQCAKASFLILSWINLQREGPEVVKKVALLSGNLDYFGTPHIYYALPAVVVIVLVTILPLILLIYPTHYKILRFFLGERRYEDLTCTKCFELIDAPLSRFKPLFDAFQGCYKDNFRFFAGLFFLYRFVIAACYAFSTNTKALSILLEIIIVLMLGFHTLCQPYENKFYNIIDSLIFTNLAIVNALNLFDLTQTIFGFQLVLIFLPLIYIVVMASLAIATKFSRKARRRLAKVNKFVPLFRVSSTDVVSSSEERRRSSIAEPDDEMPYRIYEQDQHQREMERSGIAKAAADEHKKRMYHSFESGAPKQIPYKMRVDTY